MEDTRGPYVVQRYFPDTKLWKVVAQAPTMSQAQMLMARMGQQNVVMSGVIYPRLRIRRKEDV